jgi:hypothetical protein
MTTSVVPSDQYSPAQAEDLIAALLVRTVPGAQRIDGAGGDAGVDVRAPGEGGWHIYEIKSFCRRLTAAQRRQIRDSLLTAVGSQPAMVSWTLVLPLDPSPAEDRWFTGQLQALADVPTAWLGRTQLEAELSRHRDLLRAFAPGSTERRALDLLASYAAEQAAMNRGMSDGIPRLMNLKEQFDLTDPDWAFDVQISGQDVRVQLRPKDVDAPSRRPIGVALAIDSVNDAAVAEAVEMFLKYGRPTSIPRENIAALSVDLPGNLNELVSEGELTAVAFSKSDEEKGWRLSQRIEVIRNGRVLDTLPVEWTDRSAGPMGGSWLAGRDRSGYLELALRVEPDRPGGGLEITAPASDDVLPEEAARVLRFLSKVRTGDQLRLQATGLPSAVMRISGPPLGDPDAVAAGATVAETLARIQCATGCRFPLPRSWTHKDSEMLYFCDQLLTVGEVQWYWPGYAFNLLAMQVARLLSDATLPRISMTGESIDRPSIELMGGAVVLPGKVRCQVTDMLMMNPRLLRAAAAASDPLSIMTVPLGQDDRTRSMFYLEPEPAVDEANGSGTRNIGT